MLTHRISEALSNSIKSCSEIISPPIPYNKNKESIQTLSITFGSDKKVNLLFFCMLHMRQKSKLKGLFSLLTL